MKKFYVTLAAVIIMAFLIPFAPYMAVTDHSPLTTHLLYMFAHGNVLHWAINGWALLILHNVFRWHRLLFVYLLAVALSFLIPHLLSGIAPVLGASVITTFFFGLITPYYWHHDRLTAVLMATLLIVSCVLPGFAALYHIIPYLCGLIYRQIERIIHSYRNYAKDAYHTT